MVHQLGVDALQGQGHPAGGQHVPPAGGGVAAGMVVGQHHLLHLVLDAQPDDLPQVDGHLADRALQEHVVIPQVAPAVQEHQADDLVLLPQKLGPEGVRPGA